MNNSGLMHRGDTADLAVRVHVDRTKALLSIVSTPLWA